MSGDIDVRSVLDAADRAADIAGQGWREYCGPGPGRFAGLTTAVTVGRNIPHVLRGLRSVAAGWDEWWDAHAALHDNYEAAWLGQLRAAFEHPPATIAVHEDHLDATFSRELMRRAPHGTVSWFLNDDLGRSGWTVRLADGSTQNVFFTIPMPVAKVYATLLVTTDGRSVDDVLPRYLGAMRSLSAAAHERYGVPMPAVSRP